MSTILRTAASNASLKVLSEESVQILQARGEARLISGCRSVSNTSYFSTSSLSSQAAVLIPDELDSIETLQFLELNQETSGLVWKNFLDARSAMSHWASVLTPVKRNVTSIEGNAVTVDDDWLGIMRRIGTSSNFQTRLVREDMKDMRQDHSNRPRDDGRQILVFEGLG